jgi:hypothetical protein
LPLAIGQPVDEFGEFLQHAFMDEGVSDDPSAACDFFPAGFELRFDQRDDHSGRSQ